MLTAQVPFHNYQAALAHIIVLEKPESFNVSENGNHDEILLCRDGDVQIGALMILTRPLQCDRKLHGPEYRNRS
jgi:hypothetical protein